ncbi:glycoside hydrolase N-terminal domain-containing protein [Olivibacter sp. 47]|nr:glycoside hydrolase N-terminal domain-containing protein [Olivibacter sp. 47]MDM8173675.1 glycoside hydrolase N-terminal domain-containing protein [Olivibacter sp. 47]
MLCFRIFLNLAFCLIFFSIRCDAEPLTVWYTQPAQQWEEAIPLGNGKIGMMPDGGIREETIVLNDITLWSGSLQDANNYEANNYLSQIRKLLREGKMMRHRSW